MNAPSLRPLRVGEILDAGIKIYLGNARTLMGLTALVVVPVQILDAIVLLSTASSPSDLPRGTFAASSAADRAASLGATAVIAVSGLLIGLLTTIACVKAVSDVYLGGRADTRSSLRFAVPRAGPLLWLEILMFLGLVLAFIAFIVPGIWLYAAWAVATPVLLIEGVKGRRALGRSRALVRGRWWPTAGVLLVAEIMVSLIGGAIQALLFAIVGSGASTVVTVIGLTVTSAIAAIITRPFQAAVTTVLYYDLRVRREGFDVELLAAQLGLPELRAPVPLSSELRPESVGAPGGPPFWPPPPGWTPDLTTPPGADARWTAEGPTSSGADAPEREPPTTFGA
ncbi:MAG: hypothetical protein ACR2IP_06720 [Solirubrobacteraceae bacterium]